jgi:uncharacterized sulfatase
MIGSQDRRLSEKLFVFIGSLFVFLIPFHNNKIFSADLAADVTHASRPNVLLILGDDQGWGDYGFMGHKEIQTPKLDRLAAQSLRFDRGYVPTSLCRASLATIITGLWPQEHGITSNDPPLPKGLNMGQAMKDPIFLADRKKMVERFNRQPSLAKSFTAAGYRTLQTGKWWEGEACRCGFTEGMTHGDVSKGGRHGDEGLKIGRQSLETVLQFIDPAKKNNPTISSSPFFIWYAPMMPHEPHNPPKRLVDKYRDKTPSIHVARYWAMCTWFDETVGEILEKLEKSGNAENTIVVFLADNGWIQKVDGPGFAPKSKRSPFDGGLRTPILVRYPAKLKPAKIDNPVSSTDVAPTILSLAGLKIDPKQKGVNLADFKAVANRPYLPGSVFSHNAVSIDDPSKNLEYGWIIRDNWKLIIPYIPNESIMLYDLKMDPSEEKNLVKDYPEKVGELGKLLGDWFDSTGLKP